ncbi:uncharacterized protein LAESUDRAFT_630062, partial [Laetiporus sulphureus 93-53]
FGFLNPAVIIQAAHIIPAFAYRRTADLLPASPFAHFLCYDLYFTRLFYLFDRFVDHDMFMRYLGSGIEHKGT